jgi:hypothetical protein
MESYVLTYFDWFGTSSFLPDGFGVDYTMDDLVWTYYFPNPTQTGSSVEYVTF